MTEAFVPAARRPPPAVATADVSIAAPPALPPSSSSGLAARLVPVLLSVGSLGVMAAVFFSGSASSGSAATRSPIFLAFPVMMLVSMTVTAVAGRGRRRDGDIDADRVEYLEYLGRLRGTVAETAAAQRSSLCWSHPDPATLWTLVGGPRMWERRATDSDFCVVRVGTGIRPLATRLVAPGLPPAERSDPVTATAVRRFVEAHSTIEAPITIGLRPDSTVTIDGDACEARGVLRAMVCQLAVLHPPGQLLIVAVIGERNRCYWDWLKWLPHNQHPGATDALGSARMVCESSAEARRALAGMETARVVVIGDVDDGAAAGAIPGATVVEVGAVGDGAPLVVRQDGETQTVQHPDRMEAIDALTCARRLAAYPAGARASHRDAGPGWPALMGLRELSRFDPVTLWRGQEHRLRVPIGTTVDGTPLELDIREPAENGMGPHGLCVGATGSGKSELLRTVALGMMARNSPELLNLLLVDFKGGATFLNFAGAPHVAAVITNLSDEAPMVARMRDALAGEMNRRQRILRAAGCVSVAAYQDARRTGAQLAALPTLFIVVDEFSELLSQHPDFADMFVAIGRLGRSLGMHLLLASQRLDEGRLRGLEAHLSYRVCLKTLSASESRIVLGTLDAYQLPNTPGAGFLRCGGGEPIRFQTAFVSGPLRPGSAGVTAATASPSVRLFSTRAEGPITRGAETVGRPTQTVLGVVLEGLSGHGPPAHQVWLPPLGAPPRLDDLLRDVGPRGGDLTVPVGVVDRPFEQSRTPLIVDLSGAAGNVAIVGAPRSGKSTALRTLITALAATHGPRRVQFYCLDFGGGTLASVRTLPHVGVVAGRAEPRLVARIVAEMESIVRSRELQRTDAAAGSDPFGDVFLVVDGWAALRHEFEALEEAITSLATQGLSFGVHVVLSASRWAEIRPSLKDQVGTCIELRLGDPADSEIDRRRAQQVPHGKPGRGLSREGLHMAIALPIDELQPQDGEPAAPPIRLLPAHVDRDALVRHGGAESAAGILLGLEERRLQPITVDFGHQSHLLILGDNECGKTATLRTLCREIVRTKTAAEARLLIVDFRRSLLGVVESEHLGGYAMSPAALGALLPGLLDLLHRRMPPSDASQAQLRARSWWSGPDIFVVVDDYDLVAASADNPLAAIVEYLPHARDLGLHLVVARRAGGAARALFEPLLAGLRDLGCLGLVMSARPDEGALLGCRPARLPPGRGVLVGRAGDEQVVQVAWSPPP
ncbi:type VII secretion protein EccCa [Mycobacterium sp. 663a-19]|uniref:type VII secretion protein EccCa n=1 Tax=Mycobacterium sp. 663a-19 TaxID=2986148 RepID=UPI002D1ED67E|nr:type VII secretion protein EccCa [Mycobacterium sp. 663a-19]MEB3983004.1 type VII secretion protein EccCa [Mycobacterium sp. 663a-19]